MHCEISLEKERLKGTNKNYVKYQKANAKHQVFPSFLSIISHSNYCHIGVFLGQNEIAL